MTVLSDRTIKEELAAGRLVIDYIKRPSKRVKHWESYSTAAGTATTIVDSSLTQANDFWNSCNLRLKEGNLVGEERAVSDYDLATTTLTVVTFGVAPGISIEYEMGEVSAYGDEFMPLVAAWATYLGFVKDQNMEMANTQLSEYKTGVEAVNARYGSFHRQEPSKEPPR